MTMSDQMHNKWTFVLIFICAIVCTYSILVAPCAIAAPDYHGMQREISYSNTPTAGRTPTSGSHSDSVDTSPVVFLGFSGVTWEMIDADTTPNLYEFARKSSLANLVDKTLGVTTCPNSGWLTLGTGQRTQESLNTLKRPCTSEPSITIGPDGELAESGVTTGVRVTPWRDYVTANIDNGYSPQFGSLHDALAASGVSSMAIGSRAVLALADAQGALDQPYVPIHYSAGIATNAGAAIAKAADHSAADLTMIDLGAIRASGWEVGGTKGVQKSRISAAFGIPSLDVAPLQAQARALDKQFGDAIDALTASSPDATIVAASLAESDSLTAQLQYFAATVPMLDRRTFPTKAYTNSTRHIGLVQTTDMTSTLMQLVGVDHIDSDRFVGSSIILNPPNYSDSHYGDINDESNGDLGAQMSEQISAQINQALPNWILHSLADVNQRALLTRAAVGTFLIAYGVLALLYGSALGVMFGLLKRPLRHPRLIITLGLSVSAIPASALLTNLIPWWRVPPLAGHTSAPLWVFFLLLCLIATWIGSCAMLLGWIFSREHPARTAGALIAAITAVTFIADAATGSDLHYICVLGAQQPQDGSRFYGFGNTAHITVALAFLYLAAYVADRICACEYAERHSHSLVQRRDTSPSYTASAHHVRSSRATTMTHLIAVLAVIALGLVDLFANALSRIGADFGGTVGIVVGFAVLALLILAGRVRAWQFVLVLLCGIIAASTFALADWLRPASSRTHVGEFVQEVIDGRLGQVLLRKAELFAAAGSPLVWALTVFPILGLIWLSLQAAREFGRNEAAHSCASSMKHTVHNAEALNITVTARDSSAPNDPHVERILTSSPQVSASPRDIRSRTLRYAGYAGVVLTVISLAINDSGPLLPFLGAAFAIPLWLAATVPNSDSTYFIPAA